MISLTAAWMSRAWGWNQPSRQDLQSKWRGVIRLLSQILLAKAIHMDKEVDAGDVPWYSTSFHYMPIN